MLHRLAVSRIVRTLSDPFGLVEWASDTSIANQIGRPTNA